MTRYDDPPASDGYGGPHPLAGVPQAALDAATAALMEALHDQRTDSGFNPTYDYEYGIDGEDLEPVAHSVILSVITTIESMRLLDEEPDSPCASGCRPSEGDVCGGPRCS